MFSDIEEIFSDERLASSENEKGVGIDGSHIVYDPQALLSAKLARGDCRIRGADITVSTAEIALLGQIPGNKMWFIVIVHPLYPLSLGL